MMRADIDESIAVKVWAKLYIEKMGVRMPLKLAARAIDRCKNYDELIEIVREFAAACPAIFLHSNDKALQELGSFFHSLKFDARLRTKPAADILRMSDDVLALDGRIPWSARDNKLDIYENPVCMTDLSDSIIVFVTSNSVVSPAAELVDELCAIVPSRRIIIITQDADVNVSVKSSMSECAPRAATCNLTFFNSNLCDKQFSQSLPKIATCFVCIVDESDFRNNAYPNGGCRNTIQNIVYVTGNENGPLLNVEELELASSNGYSRILHEAKHIPTEVSLRKKFDYMGFPSVSDGTSYPLLRQHLLRVHMVFDGSECERGHIAFLNHLWLQTSRAKTNKNTTGPADNRTAILAVDTRKNPVLALCLALAVRNTGIRKVVIFLPECDDAASDVAYYKNWPGLASEETHVCTMPCTTPFLRKNMFHMAAYNDLMTSAEFWECVSEHAEIVVTIQDDGTILRHVPEKVLRSWTQYDYIGAPWAEQNLPHLVEIAGNAMVGNGGVSVRNVRSMLEVASMSTFDDCRRMLFNDTFVMPEDVFFVNCLRKTNKYIAPRSVASEFSSEQLFEDGSYAMHKTYLYHPSDKVKQYLVDVETET